MALRLDSEGRELLREAVAQGFVVARSKNHIILRHPEKKVGFTMSASPSDRRGHMRAVSDFRKLGFTFRGRGFGGDMAKEESELPAPGSNGSHASPSQAVLVLLADGRPRTAKEIVEELDVPYQLGSIQDACQNLKNKGVLVTQGEPVRGRESVYSTKQATAAPVVVAAAPPPPVVVQSRAGIGGRMSMRNRIIEFLTLSGSPQLGTTIMRTLTKEGYAKGSLQPTLTHLQREGVVVKVRRTVVSGKSIGSYDLASRHSELAAGEPRTPKRPPAVAYEATVAPPAPVKVADTARQRYLDVLMKKLETETDPALLDAIERQLAVMEAPR